MSDKPIESDQPVEEVTVIEDKLETQFKEELSKLEETKPSIKPSRKKLPLTIDLLRHGQVATPSLFSAPFEEPLGMEGWKQLTIATQNTEWDVVIAPPIRRCHDFARLLAQRLGCKFVVDKRFCELDFGEWIGLSQEQIMARDPELLKQYYFQPRRFHAPGGESMDSFMNRVSDGWDELLETYAGQRVLILTHSGVIRALLGKALDLLYQK
ncbi:MAG: hypothetical protein CR976_01570, partial [Thiotrichales bacterium]